MLLLLFLAKIFRKLYCKFSMKIKYLSDSYYLTETSILLVIQL